MRSEMAEKLAREPGSNKGQNGKVLVIGGSADYTGAPSLAAKAALRTGCDLVKIYCPERIAETVAGYSENFIVRSYGPDHLDMGSAREALELTGWADSVVLGPGLGEVEQRPVREIIDRVEKPLVVDADALNAVPRSSVKNAVLTPHSGEMQRLKENMQNLNILLNRDISIVEKGSIDRVHLSNETKELEVGSPAMTVGGTGDSLAGVAGCLLSQGLKIDEAAEMAAWINGKAGELAAENKGNGMLATDLIERIPDVLKLNHSNDSPT